MCFDEDPAATLRGVDDDERRRVLAGAEPVRSRWAMVSHRGRFHSEANPGRSRGAASARLRDPPESGTQSSPPFMERTTSASGGEGGAVPFDPIREPFEQAPTATPALRLGQKASPVGGLPGVGKIRLVDDGPRATILLQGSPRRRPEAPRVDLARR